MSALDKNMVPEIKAANEKVEAFKVAAIDRARVWIEMQGRGTANFQNGNGYTVRVHLRELLDETAEKVTFYARDEQVGGPTVDTRVPREMLFNETDEEREFAEYKRLQAKFDTKK